MENMINALEKLEKIELYLIVILFIVGVLPFLIIPLMFFAFMSALEGINDLLDDEYEKDKRKFPLHIEPISPWPRI